MYSVRHQKSVIVAITCTGYILKRPYIYTYMNQSLREKIYKIKKILKLTT